MVRLQRMSGNVETHDFDSDTSSSSSVTCTTSAASNDDVIFEPHSRVPTRNATRARSQENVQDSKNPSQNQRSMDSTRSIGGRETGSRTHSRANPSRSESVTGLGTITITPIPSGNVCFCSTIALRTISVRYIRKAHKIIHKWRSQFTLIDQICTAYDDGPNVARTSF